QVSEPGALGAFARYEHADYEAGPAAHELVSGATAEWSWSERGKLAAKAGPDFVVVPGPGGVPPRAGFRTEAVASHGWGRGSLAASGKVGDFLTSGFLPASNRRELRLDGSFLPREPLEAKAFLELAREDSQHPAFL